MVEIAELKREIERKLVELATETARLQADAEKLLGSLAPKGYKIDKDRIEDFFKKFWHTYPTKNPNEWEVAIPVFIPFNIGWYDRTEGGYNIFTINKYTKWLGEDIPAFISREINLPPNWKIVVDGETIKFPEGMQEKIEDKFGSHLALVEKAGGKIKQGHEYQIIADIIESGSLPFEPRPIKAEDVQESDFVQMWDELKEKYNRLEIFEGKYSYQGKAWDIFKKYGAVGIFWAMSFGKTVIGTYIFSRIKGPKGLVVPTTTLKEQWIEFFKKNCPRLLDDVELFTYQGMSRKSWLELQKKDFALLGFDECHYLPADSFSKLATLKSKYRFGLSACVGGSTKIKCNDEWKEVKKLTEENVYIINQEFKLDVKKGFIKKAVWNDRKALLISTLSNRKINLTNDHPLLIWDGKPVWRTAENIKRDDLIATTTEQFETDEEIFIKLLGFAYGEGHLRKKSNRFTLTVSVEEKDILTKLFDKLRISYRADKKKGKNAFNIEIKSKDFVQKIIDCNYPRGKKVDQKIEFPKIKKSLMQTFLSGLFGAEGSASYLRKNRKSIYPSETVLAMNTSKEDYLTDFFDNIIKHLRMLKIDSIYKIKKGWKRHNGTESKKFELRIKSSSENLIRFLHLIEFAFSPKKQETANNTLAYLCRRKQLLNDRMGDILNDSKKISYSTRQAWKRNERTFVELRNKNVERLPTNSDIRWELVSEIKKGMREDIYDLRVPENKNFVANGFISHNTPYREDGRTNYIMALTGFPIGLDWKNTMAVLGKEFHSVNVHVVKDMEAKYQLVRHLYNPERRTIVFINLLNVGKRIAEMLDIPMISGETKKRLDLIKENKSFVASRVLELGISIKDLEHIIEVDFLFGSRREEVQRTGRLMHSIAEGKVHDIIMTKQEIEQYGKRLYGLYEKGFRYKIIPHLSGVQVNGEKEKIRTAPSKKGGVNYAEIMNRLYDEGYFMQERTVNDVCESLKRRGVFIDTIIRGAVWKKLDKMVKFGGRLYKIEGDGGYKFKSRK